MAQIPSRVVLAPFDVNGEPLYDTLTSQGWNLLNRGKVRDTYGHPDEPEHLLVVASDRLSIFDFVLGVLVPGKGEVLTALTHFWLTEIFADIPNHLVGIPTDVPQAPLKRCLRVKKKMQLFELIFRMHLGGSVWKQYEQTGTVAGHILPAGMYRWQKLSGPLFTPSTKAEVGHDVNITAADYWGPSGDLGIETLAVLADVCRRAYEFAEGRGILILDTKFEAADPFSLADEVLTPDSSRFTTVEDYNLALSEKRDPIFYDKECVRVWGRTVETPFGVTGLHLLDPENPEHVHFIQEQISYPGEVIYTATERYYQIFEMLVGMSLVDYQTNKMGIAA